MTIELYWFSGSPFAWRVMLALELKRVPYVSRLIEASKEEHKTPAYLALNPRGKVPVLKDGDLVLSESLAILAYLDRKFADPPLFGRTAEESGLIWKAIFDSLGYFEPASGRIIVPILSGRTQERADEVRAAVRPTRDELALLERRLASQPFLAGPALSAADISIYPMLELLLRAAGKEAAQRFELGLLPFEEKYPALAAWRERIRALPGYERTYPPHWR